MGIKREFNFEDDIELLNLKYQMGNETLGQYFQNEIGANEPIQIEKNNNTDEPKSML